MWSGSVFLILFEFVYNLDLKQGKKVIKNFERKAHAEMLNIMGGLVSF
jgi:hypothetical protein